MDSTTFIASIWGPILVAVSLGMFTSKSFYEKIYRDIEKDALAALVFGVLAMIVGLAQVQTHNLWGTPAQIVVTLLGWGTLVKGAVMVIAPRLADSASHSWLRLRIMPAVSVGVLVLGVYLTHLAYFL